MSQKFVGMLSFGNIFMNLSQLPASKKDCQNRASQQTFGPSYFVSACFGPLSYSTKNHETKKVSTIIQGKFSEILSTSVYAQCALCGGAGRGSTLPAPAMLRAWGEIAGLARAAHESSARNGEPRRAPLQWGSSGLDKAFSAQPGQATLSSHTYTLQG